MAAGIERPEISQLLREIDSVVSTSEQRHRAELLTLRQQVTDSNTQIGNLERQVQSHTQRNGALQSEVTQLQRQLRQYAGVAEQLDELRVQSEQLRENHEQSKTKHKRHMQRAKDRITQLEAEHGSKTSELEASRQNLQAARAQIAAAANEEQSAKKELAAVRQRNSSLSEKCSVLRQQVEQGEADRSMLQSQVHDSSQQYQKHISELESKVHTLRMTSASNMELTKSSLDKAQAQTHQLTEENLNLRRQLTKSNGDLELLHVSYACLKDELSAAKEDLQHAQSTEKRDAARLAELEHKLLQKDDVIRAFEESQERSNSADLARLQQEIDALNRRLQRSSANEAELQSKLAHVSEGANSSQLQNERLRQDLAAALSDAEQCRNTCRQLQLKESTTSEERSDAQRARLETLQLQSRLSAREEESHRWSEQLLKAEEQLRATATARDTCQAQLKVANEQLDSLRLQNASLRTALHAGAAKNSLALDSGDLNVDTSASLQGRSVPHHPLPATNPPLHYEHAGTSTTSIVSAVSSVGSPIGSSRPTSNAVQTVATALRPDGSGNSPVPPAKQVHSTTTAIDSERHYVPNQTGNLANRELTAVWSGSRSSLSKLSDMGSVSSLTVSEPDLSTTSADTHRASQDSDHSLPQPAATSHLHAPGNFRDSPGARVNTSNKTPYLSPAGLSCEVSTLTMTPSHLGSYSSAPGDISQTLMTSAEQASMFARQERNLFREEFVQGFLTDHMSLLQTRIEETMQRLGLDEDKT